MCYNLIKKTTKEWWKIYNKNYGIIDTDGSVKLEFSGEGMVYKNIENFNSKEGVCYMAENDVGEYHEDIYILM